MVAATGEVAIDHERASYSTLLILLWALRVLFWSIFTPPHRTFAARVLLFQPLWSVRVYFGDSTWVQDLALALTLHIVFNYRTGIWRLPVLDDFKWIDFNDYTFMIYLKIFSLLAGCGILAGCIVYRGQRLNAIDRKEHLFEQSIDEGLLPPLLITSRTSHSRIFPEKHTFSYSYLFVGIPVGRRGRISRALSVDSETPAWFNVNSADYLLRGSDRLGLAGKLKSYLHTQGITDRDYAFAFLVTAPRFLGYSFNPVSFWYLYDSGTALRYMILEVNNTFDERRIYLLKAGSFKEGANGSLNLPNQDPESSPKKMLFTETFDKDFHVSPFNSRKGSYTLRATDPLIEYQETGHAHIDNTIMLRSSKESSKIVARVWSEGAPREANRITRFQLLRFIASWWWVGFITFPRIVWQAQKLFFYKKLHVWYRSEVAESSIGRTYTNDEKQLEVFFRAFLEHSMQLVKTPLRLVYEPAHMEGEQIAYYSPGLTYEEGHARTLTLTVTSPAFYSRFVHYAHVDEAFIRECLATDEKNRTVNVTTPTLLPVLFDAMRKTTNQKTNHKQTILDQLRWSFLRRIRCPPAESSYPGTDNSSQDYDITDIRSFGDSDFDSFVTQHAEDASLYRRIVTKLFLAQRFTLGLPLLISALDWLLRTCFLWVTMYICSKTSAGDVLRPNKYGSQEVMSAAVVFILANSVHLWSFLKG